MSARARRWLLGAVAVIAIVAGLLVLPGTLVREPRPARPRAVAGAGSPVIGTATVASTSGRRIPPSFISLSTEYWSLAADMGVGGTPDPLMAPLLRGMASGGGAALLRVGGRNTDAAWWDPTGRPRPPGIKFDITPAWLARLRSLLDASGARTLLGLNLASRNPVYAATWARAAARGLPARDLRAFEIGNEPDLYGHVAWYGRRPSYLLAVAGRGAVAGRPAARAHFARARSYDEPQFEREFRRWTTAVSRAVPHARFIGPGWSTAAWMPMLAQFVRHDRARLSSVSWHRYPLRACFTPPIAPTIANLLAPASSRGLAAQVAPYVRLAHANGLPFELTELNSIACGGKRGVSDSFASALWALDAFFALASTGVSHVAVHERPDTWYTPFVLRRKADGGWSVAVRPLYDAMRIFSRMTPAGARLVPVHVAAGQHPVRAWATRDRNGTVRVVLIDDDAGAHGVVRVALPPLPSSVAAGVGTSANGSPRVAAASAGAGAGTAPPANDATAPVASAERLDAASLRSTRQPTFAGQIYAPDGRRQGPRTVSHVRMANGAYPVPFNRPGAVLLTIAPGR